MKFRREGDAGEKGQSPIIGIVLMIGMVAAVSVSLFLVSGDLVSGMEQQSEQERVEQSFVELSQQMSSAATNDDVTYSMKFESGRSGAITKTNAGTITIESGNFSETIQLGAIEYRGDDGSIIAYQAGGVWRERGNKTRMLSAPPLDYNAEEETLWLSVADITEDEELSSGEVTMVHKQTDPIQDFVENDSVTLTITSDYYRGWERYFRTKAGGASVRNVDHENRTITVLLGYAELDNAFDEGATIASDNPDHFHDKHGSIGDDHRTGTPLPEMDSTIDRMVKDAKNGQNVTKNLSNESYSNPLGSGTYFIEEINGTEDYEFDLSNGNATLIVEGDVNLKEEGSINVTDRDAAGENVLRIYSGGNHTLINGKVCANSCGNDAEVIQFYGPSTMAVDFGPGNTGQFEGVLYVASDEEEDWWNGSTGKCEDYHQVHMQGGGEFYGSIVAYSVCAHSSSVSFDYDSDLENATIDPYYGGYTLPPQITYLNIAHHKIDVENE